MNERPTPEDLAVDLASCLHSADQYTLRADDAGRLAVQLKSVVRRALHAEARCARLEQALHNIVDQLEPRVEAGSACTNGINERDGALIEARAALEEIPAS